ncbi:pentatricopeptide repeat-containing protein At5g48910-like [Tripterygium wilfordii]|uniref:pentatricopeptide repeat-containing protein At5g48910-like n=1 Tax=Tripterygium wilfordii TaxID=458696 RepID=UPI0018F842A4|nr:pentatricopeptide repeat-containing protein At5g48910-like [Tripterygium wilfordii]
MSTTIAINFSSHPKPKDLSEERKPISKLTQKSVLELLDRKCTSSLQHLKQVHAFVIRTAHIQDHYVAGTLLKCYLNPDFSNLDCAIKVFNCVPNPNVFVWNTILKGCLEKNEPYLVMYFYSKMVLGCSRPNKFTFPTLLKACSITQDEREGVQVHAHVVKKGFSGNVHLRSSGVRMYASFGKVEEARRMLDGDGDPDVVCWNAMIDGYFKCGNVAAAKELFDSMPKKNIGSYNAMISGLAECGMIEVARNLFDEMTERDDISWSAMIDGYIKAGNFKEALEVFNSMQKEKIGLQKFVLSSVLAGCANVGALDQGRWIHAYIVSNSIHLDPVLGTALLDMYAKCGCLDLAWDVFEKMKKREDFTWNAMIGGLAIHGRANEAVELFCKMQREKVRPNGITFVSLLNACAHAGMVDKGLQILNSMKREYGIEPAVEHYGCVVDLLGRAGKLSEAEELINSMPVKPDAAVWGALLGACRKHENVELGEKVGKILLEIEPENSGRYALLSNIYAKVGRWDDAAEVRILMKERGVKTAPGCSMIDLGGRVHEFKMGEGLNPQMKEIYLMLEKIIQKLKMEGYSPDTTQVLFDIEEGEKEITLMHHSEKLAIAFGLINTRPGTTIRVLNNLRMCEDCHSAGKLISRVYNREIMVRDRVRYHHFTNGACTCQDFW